MKDDKDEKKQPNHNWQRTVTVRKQYPCEVCDKKIKPGSKAKYRVRDDNIVVHAHVDCAKKGKPDEKGKGKDGPQEDPE
jgi:RNase P subunit RPR2